MIEKVDDVFRGLGYNTDILRFDPTLEGQLLEQQPMYKLWHLLYSFEGDNSNLGNEKLIEKLCKMYGFDKENLSKNVVNMINRMSFSSRIMAV